MGLELKLGIKRITVAAVLGQLKDVQFQTLNFASDGTDQF